MFGNQPGGGQWSMYRYAQTLLQALKDYCSEDVQVQLYIPPSLQGKGRWSTYWSRYVDYPRAVRAQTSEETVNHITDHGNSHLLRALPAERTLVTCHDLILLRSGELTSDVPAWRRYVFERLVSQLSRAARIIAISQTTKQDLVTLLHLSGERIDVIPYGLDHRTFYAPPSDFDRAHLRNMLGWHWPYTILHVGTTLFYKNIEGILETLAILHQKYPGQVHLVRAGKPLTDAQRDRADRLGITSLIHDLGPRGDAELRSLYWAADVLFFPSWWEGFGWPPLEAMACGTPVVVSDRGALVEVTGPEACRVPPENAPLMAEALQQVLMDGSTRERLSHAGLTRAAQFQWEKAARSMVEAYAKFADAGKESPV